MTLSETKPFALIKDRLSWIHLQKDLLDKEREAEVEAAKVQVEDVALKQLEAKGIAINRLSISEISTGLFGRPTVTLVPRKIQGLIPPLPSHCFSSGDIVGVWECGGNNKDQITSGVVAKVTSSSIQIALDEESTDLDQLPDNALFRIHKLANDVTYRRIKNGLVALENIGRETSSHLIEVLFMEAAPYEPLPEIPTQLLHQQGGIELFNKSLDESQVDAVKFALMRKDLAVIHGPPGTGKTTTLVEVILQHVKLGCKVLAVAPSNLAVDNMLEKLVETKVSVVRVGHPARATPKAQQKSLDAQIQFSEDFNLIKDIHKDIKSSLVSLSKTKEKGKRFRLKDEIKNLRKELKEREVKLSKDILSRSQVVLTTLTSAGNAGPLKLLPQEHFDLTVIDECSQGLECACYLSAMKAPKLLIAGDHHQLPPTILSPEAAKKGFLVSLMERVIEMYKDQVTRMLKIQYRMNSAIMDWASEALYEKLLVAHPSVESHLLCHMDRVDANEDTENALVLIDTAGCDFEEVSGEDLSKGNEGESAVVAEHVKRLIEAGVNEKEVAVISPYNLQVEMIRSLLRESHPGVEVRSVDGFQGREKEAIVLSLVRSNKQGEIGFLSEDRRLNVAVTRARRQLTLVCDTDTVCRHPFIQALVKHITDNGIVKSAHEYDAGSDVQSRPAFHIAPLDPAKKESKKTQNTKENKKGPKTHPGGEKSPLTEEEAEIKRKEYEAKIVAFLDADEVQSLEFPKELNSFERLLVHEIAEKKGLIHESQGEKKDRFIVLRKRGKEQDAEGNQEEIKEESEEIEKESEEIKKEIEEIKKDSEEIKKESEEIKKEKEEIKKDEEGKKEIVDLNSDSNNEDHTKASELRIRQLNGDCKHEEKENKLDRLENHLEENKIDSQTRETSNSQETTVPSNSKKPKKKKEKQKDVSTRPKVDSVNSVSKVNDKPKTINCETLSPTSPDRGEPALKPIATKKCKICSSEVNVRNFELHLLRCERIRKENSIKEEINKRKTEIKGVKKKKNKSAEPDDDFEIMNRYAKENNSCAFPRCKNPSIILLQLCSFCKNNFCLKHHQAEIHGCGEEAKKHARTVLLQSVRNGVLTPGSGILSKKPDPVKRSQLLRKLDKKMGDLESQRKNKKKD